jgi:hypothetical protein
MPNPRLIQSSRWVVQCETHIWHHVNVGDFAACAYVDWSYFMHEHSLYESSTILALADVALRIKF